jgi:hypothetical protein
MRILPLLLVGLSALALSACDELKGSRQQASTDCCCKTCPTPPPAKPAAAPAEEEAPTRSEKVETVKETEVHATKVRKHKTVGHRRVQRTDGGYRAGGYRYRTGTEGVGYLDEELAGGPRGGAYRRVEIDERETYSERYSSSESSSGYSSSSHGYSEGSYESYEGGHGRGGHKRKRDRSYVGTDRNGYLTWPGKTP